MKTRVRPYSDSSLYDWYVEVYDPYIDKWVRNSEHNFFWKAKWRAKRLAKQKLEIYVNGKELFVERMKNGDGDCETSERGV